MRACAIRVESSPARANEVEGWYLDTRATSHMIGRAAAFLVFDHVVQGTVQFSDGSIIPIQGRKVMTFTGKTRKQIKLAGVLYIPHLKKWHHLSRLA
jgi:hypothetical protein